MQIELIKENSWDGSADYMIDLSAEEQSNLIRWAIVEAIKRAAEEGKTYDPGELSMGDATSGGEDSVHGSGEQPSQPKQLDLFPETLEVSSKK